MSPSIARRTCSVYRSQTRPDTYLYLDGTGDLSRVPGALRTLLGELVFVMVLELWPGRRLARADAGRVIAALDRQGYYLQTPPPRPLG